MSKRYGRPMRSQVVASALIVSLCAFVLNVVEARPLRGLGVAGAILFFSLSVHASLLRCDRYHRWRAGTHPGRHSPAAPRSVSAHAGTLSCARHSIASKALTSLRKRWPPPSTKTWQAKRYQISSSTKMPS
jgi:hypothetical protein